VASEPTHRSRATTGPVPARRDDVPRLVARVTGDETLGKAARAQALRALAVALAASARAAGVAAVASGRWLTDQVVDLAPRIPVRDLPTLRAHHEGLTGDELAERLITHAGRVTGAIGAAGGAIASVEFAAPPLLLSAPVQLLAETIAVVAVELKLVAELHVVYGRTPPGNVASRANAYVTAWARRRGLDRSNPAGLVGVLGGAVRREVRQRLMRRAGRNVTTFAPFFTGAVAGAELNRRETRHLGDALVTDLRRR